jgi:hypothetical protein
MEDALRGTVDDDKESFPYMRPVTTNEFLSALFHYEIKDEDRNQPKEGNDEKEEGTANPENEDNCDQYIKYIPESGKAGQSQGEGEPRPQPLLKNEPPIGTEETNPNFSHFQSVAYESLDDWDTDEEDPMFTMDDQKPDPKSPKFFDFILNEIRSWDPPRRSRRLQKQGTARQNTQKATTLETAQENVKKLANGFVFFNHFICLKTKLRPSILLKAWNRGAAIMTKAQTHGIDFVIPILMKNPDGFEKKLGPLFGEWTAEQEEAARHIVSAIFIDSKNVVKMSATEICRAAEKCRPTIKNFLYHKQTNPFISLVPSFGSEPFPDSPLTLFKSPPSHLSGNQPLQLKLTARGVSAHTYKCLQNRPNTEGLLQQLLAMDRNPLRGLKGKDHEDIKGGIIDCLPLQCHPKRET